MSAKRTTRAAILAEIARWEKIAYFDRNAENRSDARDHLCVLRPMVARWTVDASFALAESEEESEN